ncbi:NADPH-dependent glutamate synthase [Natranaerobius trueperi]|uniref:Glutamate synthase (NADPH), homotetrameric n=1 Tax=Natranaerobius trueperi TaxID=759412 RepID=A0A226BX50_9FIRM|nr:NADPH-dependent glutamate synthase [Natranaerobius trueperi]OWZ83576.1 glutamate synthase (NADPH), homotetrameric [Natranaerobius trueperi]
MSRKVKTKHEMPVQDSKERITNFDEVALGYNEEKALAEANRCLECKVPNCMKGCPVEINIPKFIGAIKQKDYKEAIREIKTKNSLPAVCGRVCPQEAQCEKYCVIGKKGDPVGIGRLERFVADWEFANENSSSSMEVGEPTGKKVAIVGSGPAGLTAAGDLAKMGHSVTIFEALHVPGGVLMYGIPEFRLPKDIVQKEIDKIKELGVDIKVNYVVGKAGSVKDFLENGYDAVFVGTGAGLPYFMNIPGENLNGVYSANEFLTRTNLMKAYQFPDYLTPVKVGKRFAVIGAGNVAMDAARCALRLGAEESYIVYRRSEEEIPARAEEIEHAREEGVKFLLLTSPVEFHGDENYNLNSMTCIEYELGEPDDSGRRRPIPIEGSEYKMDVENVVLALGQGPNPLVPSTTPGLDLTKKGNILTNDETGVTSIQGVFAGGDIVTGAATVIEAMGAGKKAARAIDEYIKSTN